MSEVNALRSDQALDALGNPVRRHILHLLSEHPRSVVEIANLLPISRPAVSKHLKILQDASLVSFESVGTQHVFSVDLTGMEEARGWLNHFWEVALLRFKLVAENLTETP